MQVTILTAANSYIKFTAQMHLNPKLHDKQKILPELLQYFSPDVTKEFFMVNTMLFLRMHAPEKYVQMEQSFTPLHSLLHVV